MDGVTYNQRLACIRSFFTYAAAAEPVLAVYLADLAAIPRLKGPAAAPVKYMSTDAVTALLAVPDPGTRTGLRDQFFMILMYDLAARDGEMLTMTLADIDARRLTADLLGKGSKPRRLPITTQTAQHFERYVAAFHPSPDPAAPMFYTMRNHRPALMSDDNVARFIRQHAATAKARCPDVPDRSTRICCATPGPCISTRTACPWLCLPNGSGTPTQRPLSSTRTPTRR